MADHANDGNEGGGDRDVFIYRGGRAPQHVTHVASINPSRKVGRRAFNRCKSLRSIVLRSVVGIDSQAFDRCENLVDVGFGDKLETIGKWAFAQCTSLQRLKLPSIITIKTWAFTSCKALSSIEFSERLEKIEPRVFHGCDRLRHIMIPLKRDLFPFDPELQGYNQFDHCNLLTTVDLVVGAHTKTIASLHMESWGTAMKEEINRIIRDLPNSPYEKSAAIKQWMDSVIDKMEYYKAAHHRYVKEGVTLLELALWKAKLAEKDETTAAGRTNKVKLDAESARKEKRVTCDSWLAKANDEGRCSAVAAVTEIQYATLDEDITLSFLSRRRVLSFNTDDDCTRVGEPILQRRR
eukprot:scaffold924_cov74-Skeletonema_marinoi.AAC.1